eukprot:3495222-Rhodomonas_salina.5
MARIECRSAAPLAAGASGHVRECDVRAVWGVATGDVGGCAVRVSLQLLCRLHSAENPSSCAARCGVRMAGKD